ncbi:succinylglutamic semialdehyde dehydrogenase [Burkholderia mallei]|nr:succinylglutamic semialdehyde dehydrogenase [Burkholderia mallei]
MRSTSSAAKRLTIAQRASRSSADHAANARRALDVVRRRARAFPHGLAGAGVARSEDGARAVAPGAVDEEFSHVVIPVSV